MTTGQTLGAAMYEIDRIRALHREDKFAIQQQIRSNNARLAYLRILLGWSLDKTEKDRKRIAKWAASIVDAVTSGRPLEGDDADIAIAAGGVIQRTEDALKPWDELRRGVEKEMVSLVKNLPGYDYVQMTNGVGDLSYARIIGEAGDLRDYPSHSHLWKRMGLAVMDGVRQGGLRKGASADDWIRHGYSGKRRSVMFVVGDSLVNSSGVYRVHYLDRLVKEHAKARADGLRPATTTETTVQSWVDRGLPPLEKVTAKELKDGCRSAKHMHNRAKRWIEKRLLRDLWNEWQGEAIERLPQGQTPSASLAA